MPGGRVTGALPKSQVGPGRRGRRTAGNGSLSENGWLVPRAAASSVDGRGVAKLTLNKRPKDQSRLNRGSGTFFLCPAAHTSAPFRWASNRVPLLARPAVPAFWHSLAAKPTNNYPFKKESTPTHPHETRSQKKSSVLDQPVVAPNELAPSYSAFILLTSSFQNVSSTPESDARLPE